MTIPSTHPEYFIVDYRFDDGGFDGVRNDVLRRDPATGAIDVLRNAWDGKALNSDAAVAVRHSGATLGDLLSTRLDINGDRAADRAAFKPSTQAGHGDALVFVLSDSLYAALDTQANRERFFGDKQTRVDFNHDGSPDYAEQNGAQVFVAINHRDGNQ